MASDARWVPRGVAGQSHPPADLPPLPISRPTGITGPGNRSGRGRRMADQDALHWASQRYPGTRLAGHERLASARLRLRHYPTRSRPLKHPVRRLEDSGRCLDRCRGYDPYSAEAYLVDLSIHRIRWPDDLDRKTEPLPRRKRRGGQVLTNGCWEAYRTWCRGPITLGKGIKRH